MNADRVMVFSLARRWSSFSESGSVAIQALATRAAIRSAAVREPPRAPPPGAAAGRGMPLRQFAEQRRKFLLEHKDIKALSADAR